MTISANNVAGLVNALNLRGFFLVTDLPNGTRIEIRRGEVVVRFP